MRSTVAGSHAAQVLKGGDMILAVNGKPVTCFSDVEDVLASGSFGLGSKTNVAGAAVERAEETPSKRRRTSVGKGGKGPAAVTEASPKPPPTAAASGQGTGHDGAAALMTLTVFRSGQDAVQEVLLQPGLEDGMGTNRIVHFCGAQLQVGVACTSTGLLDMLVFARGAQSPQSGRATRRGSTIRGCAAGMLVIVTLWPGADPDALVTLGAFYTAASGAASLPCNLRRSLTSPFPYHRRRTVRSASTASSHLTAAASSSAAGTMAPLRTATASLRCILWPRSMSTRRPTWRPLSGS